MDKRKKTKRYLNEVDEEQGKTKLKTIKKANFNGDIIKVEMKPMKYKKKKFQGKIKNSSLDPDIIKKYSRGKQITGKGVRTNFFKEKVKRKEVVLEYATEQAVRSEVLRNEIEGFIQAEDGERTSDFRQKDIIENVDITSASKNFNLKLDFGPYKHNYTKNGRHLLLGGKRGHVAAFDWIAKRLHCEINVMEEVTDISWLHIETMFAVAQKKWVYFYDNQGTEMHCVKRLFDVNLLEFLPYHFLLAAASRQGFLSWLDVSIGGLVGHYNSNLGDIRIMRQNPSNGVLCVGGGKGVVSLWSPKEREPLAKLLCHSTPISSLALNSTGQQLVTSGLDNSVKIWDIRKLNGSLAIYKFMNPISHIDISHKGTMAFSMGKTCHIYNKKLYEDQPQIYLRHKSDCNIQDIGFCPYEDVLGISSNTGFDSVLVPGSGLGNFDSFESNPFQTKSQRRENEVHALMEKVPAEFISLDPSTIAGVDVQTLHDKIEAKKSLFYLKPPKVDFKSRRKMKGKGGSVNAAKNKQIAKNLARKEFIQDVRSKKKKVISSHKVSEDFIPLESNKSSVLDRFNKKIK
ncbi:WDR46 family protein [Megaselia abdita]